jgi:hypothetical protein
MAGKSDTIAAYLDGPRTWEEGVALYRKYGSNRTLLRIFDRSGETVYNYKRLQEEIRQLLEEMPRQARRIQPQAEKSPTALPKDDPRLIPLYRERQLLHARLMLYPTDKERKQAALRIVEITRELDQMQSSGAEQVQGASDVDMHRRLMSNRAYISKNRSNQDKQEEVQKRIQENQQIEKYFKK